LTTSIADVREALAAACRIRATAYVTESVNTPVAVIARGEVNYDLVMGRGADMWNYTITVYVSLDEKRAQKYLDDLCEPTGATSLKTLVEADTALAALIDYVVIRTVSEVQSATVGTVDYLLVVFTVDICY